MKIPYNRQFIDTKDIEAVVSVLRSSHLTQGKIVSEFEKNIKFRFKSKYCIALNSGTAALHLAIKALKIKKDQKIITSPISFISTASSIMMNDLIPTFADIDEKTFTIDPNQTEDAVKKDKKIKAIIGVDYAGHPCDWKALNYIKKKYNLKLINDNCHAMGAKLDNSFGYAVKYSDLVTHSYHAIKNFTTGEGGSVLTNDRKLAELINKYRSHNMIRSKEDLKKNGRWFYRVNEYGYNYRLTDMQCALGITQLAKLKKFVEKRRVIAKIYDDLLKNQDLLKIPQIDKNIYHSFHIYPLLINFKKSKINKKKLFENLTRKKIYLQVNYQPLHLQPFLKNKYGFKKGDFPISEKFYQNEVSLPIFYNLNKSQQNYVVRNLLSNLLK
jgi:dTDP-4-amino-4,6-dideoxygalactose transaminase